MHVLPGDCFADDHLGVLSVLDQLVARIFELNERLVLDGALFVELLGCQAVNHSVFACRDHQKGRLGYLLRYNGTDEV